jgi:hypothetical protein
MSPSSNVKYVEYIPDPIGAPTKRFGILTQARVKPSVERKPITALFVEAMNAFLHDPAVKDAYRGLPTDFTRDRYFTFPRICVAILKERARSAQARMLRMFNDGAFGAADECPTASAFYQARAKVLAEFFHEWTCKAVSFYNDNFSEYSLITRWRGWRVWAVDCSIIRLPDTPETRYFYSIQTNQFPDSETVCGLASIAHDVLNEVPMNACLEKAQAEKDLLFKHHFKYFRQDTIVLYDRGYADYAVVATHVVRGINFVIRFPSSNTYKDVEEFVKSSEQDRIISLRASPRYKAQVKAGEYPDHVRVRLVKIVLRTGEVEILMTSLLDQVKYKIADIKVLYHMRWGVETSFDRLKNQLEVECFSSGNANNVKQDFHAAVFLQVLEAIMSKAQDWQIRARSIQRGSKHVYRINKSKAYTILSDHLVGLFLKGVDSMTKHTEMYQKEIRSCKSPIRPNRHKARPVLTSMQRFNHIHYEHKRS